MISLSGRPARTKWVGVQPGMQAEQKTVAEELGLEPKMTVPKLSFLTAAMCQKRTTPLPLTIT